MKAINDNELDTALDKLKTIKRIARECIKYTNETYSALVLNTILEVIDE